MLLLLLAVLITASAARDYDSRRYFAAHIDTAVSSQPLADFVDSHRFKFENQVPGLDDFYVFSINKTDPYSSFLGNYNSENHSLLRRDGFEDEYDTLVANQHLKAIHMLEPKWLHKRMPVPVEVENDMDEVFARDFVPVDSSQQPIKELMDKLDIKDPIFPQQWHLLNTQYPGNDVNASGLWLEGITGKGVVVAVIDDGLDYESADLKDNFNAKGSYDFNDNLPLPKPRLSLDYHGTRCAGEIAAVKNDACGLGVAYGAQVSGVRILSKAISSDTEAAAMVYGLDVNDIYSCSWGPSDDGKTLSGPEKIVKQAMIKGVQDGRQGKGAIYVFASGNGGRLADSCNMDGYTNSIYSITVGAIDFKGLHPSYSEACSAVMVVTYSSGSREHIHTTDYHGKCTDSHGGTSAAAPLAAGIFALVLQANPNLTWRDLQYVAALSSVPVNEQDGNYQTTALKRQYSHKYGYGKIDAYRMVKFAQTWKNVKPQAWYYSDVQPVNAKLEFSGSDTDSKVLATGIVINSRGLDIMNFEQVEHVTVTVNIRSAFRGQVGVRLISPFGTVSDLATFRRGDKSSAGFMDWTFTSVAHWGEKPIGVWKIEVFNSKSTNGVQGNSIEFIDWQLRLFGTSIDAEKAEKFDIDKDYAAIRRDRLGDTRPETTQQSSSASSSTVMQEKPTTQTTEQTQTTENKPTETISSTQLQSTDKTEAASSSTDTTQPLETHNTEAEASDAPEGEGKATIGGHGTGIYLMAIAVAGFVALMVIMKFHKTPGSSRRRRRDDYEFDIIPGEDYSDSENETTDAFDLGGRHDERLDGDEERDRLFDEMHSALPAYEDEEMFKIEDDEESSPKKKVEFVEPEQLPDTDKSEQSTE